MSHHFLLFLRGLHSIRVLHDAFALVLIFVFISQLLCPAPRDFAASASYTLNQSAWSGGASSGTVTYPVNVTTTYSSVSNISAGANLQLAPSTTVSFGGRVDVSANTNVGTATTTPNNVLQGATIITNTSTGVMYVAYRSYEYNSSNLNISVRTSTDGGLTWGTRRDVTANESGDARSPALAVDSSGSLYVAYHSKEYNASIYNIALRTSTDGGLTWGARRDATTNGSGAASSASLARDTSGNIYVAYHSGEYNASFFNIALRTSTDGGLTWGTRRDVTTNGSGAALSPNLALDSTNILHVAYYSLEFNYATYNIALRTSTDGGLTWGARRDATANATSQSSYSPVLALDSSGSLNVAYNSTEYNVSFFNIALRTSTDGGLTWGARRDVTVNAAATSTATSFIIDSSGNFYVTYNSTELDASFFNIALRTSTDAGLTWSARFDVTTSTAINLYYPIITRDVSDNIFILYQSKELNSWNNLALRGSNLGNYGTRKDVTNMAMYDASVPKVVINTSTGAMYIVYHSNEYNASSTNIALRTSTDGGVTWGTRRDITISMSTSQTSPRITLDQNGSIYVTYLSKELNSTFSNIAFRTSTDGGLTWGERRDLTTSTVASQFSGSLVKDNSGNIYVAYRSGELTGSSITNIALRTSTDGGLTWGDRRDVTANALAHSFDPFLVLDSTNNLYIAYVSKEFFANSDNVALRKSTDGGLTWGARMDVTTMTGVGSGTPVVTFAIDSSDNLYIAYFSVEFDGNINNIALRTSTDGGLTLGVRRDVTANIANSSINPIITTDLSGNIYVVYLSREYSSSLLNNVALRTSTDGGLTWGARIDLSTSTIVSQSSPTIVLDSRNNINVGYASKELVSTTQNIAFRKATGISYFVTGTITSVPFDSGSTGNEIEQITWQENAALPGGTSATFSLRTATSSASLSNAAWTDFGHTSGTFKWAKRLGGAGVDINRGISIDSAGNIITIGYVNGDVDVNGDGDTTDGGAESSAGYGGNDILISVFNSVGVWQWAKRLGGISSDVGRGITTDSANNIIITGAVVGVADVNGDGDATDGGAESSTGYGSNDIIVSVFNSSGVWQWAKRLGGG